MRARSGQTGPRWIYVGRRAPPQVGCGWRRRLEPLRVRVSCTEGFLGGEKALRCHDHGMRAPAGVKRPQKHPLGRCEERFGRRQVPAIPDGAPCDSVRRKGLYDLGLIGAVSRCEAAAALRERLRASYRRQLRRRRHRLRAQARVAARQTEAGSEDEGQMERSVPSG